ncbi:MAG: Uma2 family endonuclease [Bryobacteraceae bacterium]
MSTKTGLSLENYVRTSFPDLDREYLDGEIVERSGPEIGHGVAQGNLYAFFRALRGKLPLFPTVETRTRVSAERVRIPDVSVYSPVMPSSPALGDTPFIVIEILSPDDRMSGAMEKLHEYKAAGIAHIWVADPHTRRLYAYSGALTEVPAFRLPEFNVEIAPAGIFD